jgi:hypothetical protein
METLSTKIKDLKKGNKVIFYGEQFEITKDAQNFGLQENHKISNTVEDVWIAECKIITNPKKSNICSILKTYDRFQGNGRAKQQVII